MTGIPAQRRFGGVPFTIRAPHDLGQAEKDRVFRGDGRNCEGASSSSQRSTSDEKEKDDLEGYGGDDGRVLDGADLSATTTVTGHVSTFFGTLRKRVTSAAAEKEEEGGRRGAKESDHHKHEALLVVALPRCLLERLPGHEDDDGLHLLPAEILRAMRPSTFSGVFDQGLWLKGVVCLPPTCVLRVYTLVGSEALGAATAVATAAAVATARRSRTRTSTSATRFLSSFSFSGAVAANNEAQRVGSVKGLRRKSAATLRSLAPQWIFEGDDYFEMGHHLASVDDVETVTSTIDLARSMVRSCATKVHRTTI